MNAAMKTETPIPTIVDVDVYRERGSYVVRPVWSGVDRNDFAWGLGPNGGALAVRLKRALIAGKVYSKPQIMTDTAGKTFVSALAAVRGRCLNADLRAIGF